MSEPTTIDGALAELARLRRIGDAAREWAAMRRAYWQTSTFADAPVSGGPTRAQMVAAERKLLEAVGE